MFRHRGEALVFVVDSLPLYGSKSTERAPEISGQATSSPSLARHSATRCFATDRTICEEAYWPSGERCSRNAENCWRTGMCTLSSRTRVYLNTFPFQSMDELIDKTIPKNIRLKQTLKLDKPMCKKENRKTSVPIMINLSLLL